MSFFNSDEKINIEIVKLQLIFTIQEKRKQLK